MLAEVVWSDVPAGFDGCLHPHLPQKIRQHRDTLEFAGASVSILVVELARLGNKRWI